MDAKETTPTGEIGSSEKRTPSGSGDVVVMISGEEEPKQVPENKDGKDPPPKPPAESSSRPPKIVPVSWSAPEPPSPHGKPPRVPVPNEALLRRRTLARSAFSKPKSRFGEQPVPIDPNVLEDHSHVSLQQQFSTTSQRFSQRISSINLSGSIRAMSMATAASPGRVGLDEAEEIYRKVSEHKEKRNGVTCVFVVELVALLSLVVLLAASLTVSELEDYVIWGLEVWKWCVLVLVTFCGLLVINWFMNVVVFLIEKNYLLKNKVLYFVYGLKQSVQVFIWLCVILTTWVLLFDDHGKKRSRFTTKVLHYITWTLVSIMIGSVLWLVKTLLIKILASNFQLNRFFERTQESIFHHYVMQTLSGPALIEEAERVGRTESIGQFSLNSTRKGKGGKEKKEKKKVVIDMYQLHKMKQGKVSSWYMKTLVDAVTSSGLTMSDTLQNFDDDGAKHEITNEMEATAAAYHIFKNVAQPGAKYIEEDDLMRFMIKEEVDFVFPMFEGAETGRIDLKSLTNWVVKVYQGRKALAHALSDTKTAVLQLNRLVSAILVVLTITIWVLLTEIATKVLYFLGTQILAAAFIFKNSAKTIFEAIIFVFVMHPYDVGDRCVIDGVPLMVEEMNLLSTVFLKLNNEKVYYPNAVLATKAITNYYRSPDMGDMIPFSISFSTPLEKIGLLRERIQKFFIDNPHHWYPVHNMVVQEIENVNKITINLFCFHTMNFQDFGEKNRRRTGLVMGLKAIFEDLGINYELLPQDVRLAQIQNNH